MAYRKKRSKYAWTVWHNPNFSIQRKKRRASKLYWKVFAWKNYFETHKSNQVNE